MKSDNVLKNAFVSYDEIPESLRIDIPIHQKHILINGEFLEWNGPTHLVFSPICINEQSVSKEASFVIGSYPLATTNEAGLALNAAVNAYDGGRGLWPSMSVQQRITCLEDFTHQMIARKKEIVNLIIWEIGKGVKDAEKEFDRTITYILETIKAVKRLSNSSSVFQIQENFMAQAKKLPHGVVLCMGPFNYPLNETFTTLIPAVIMGNTILFKPPKQGTLLFEPLLEAFRESFPAGVINTVYGRGRDVVPFLMQSGKVDVLALIGSSKVADSLKKMHPKSNRLKSILGLDAKNAAIILNDTDIEQTVKEAVAGALSFNGQRCTALKILFVHEDIVEQFNKRLIEDVDRLVVGMPWTENVTITPLAEPGKPQYLQACIHDAVEHGATVINSESGGGTVYHTLMKPAIVFPVNSKMKLYQEEQFGPIIPVIPFSNIQTAVDYVKDSPYGQQVSIFSKDGDKIAMLIDMLAGQVGRININSQCQRGPDTFPFNGRKDSAEGTLSIEEALNAFSVDSIVAAKENTNNKQIFENILAGKKSKRLSDSMII